MHTRIAALAGLATLALAFVPAAAQAPQFVVIVHAANATARLTKAEVSRAFMRTYTRFPNGTAVEPTDLTVSAPARAAFSRSVHARSAAAVNTYWRQQVFSGRLTPPPEQRTEADVVRYVASHRGGIGYVGPSAVTPRVRVLPVTGL